MNDPAPSRPARRGTRTGVQIGLWVAAAAGALLLGMTAVGSIGTGLGSGGLARPLPPEEIAARLAARPAPVTGAPAPSGEAAPRPGPPAVVPAGPAGTVLVRCAGATPRVVSVNPAQGFEAEDDAPRDRVHLDGDDVTVEVALSCTDGVPSGRVATVADDDG